MRIKLQRADSKANANVNKNTYFGNINANADKKIQTHADFAKSATNV